MPRVISANENETLLDAFKGLGEKLQDRSRGRSEREGGGKREREAVTNQVLYRGKKKFIIGSP